MNRHISVINRVLPFISRQLLFKKAFITSADNAQPDQINSLEASPAGLSGSNPIRALVIDVAFVHIRKMSFGGRTIIVSVPLPAHLGGRS